MKGLVCALVLAIGVQAGQPSVRPQDDLHQFANAAWMAGASLSRERVTVNASTALIDQVELDLRAIIEGLATDESANGRPEVRQALSLYASMMNQAEVERRGLDPLKADLARIDGIQTRRDLAVVAGYLSSIAAGGPFEAQVSVDASDLSVPVVRLVQGGTLLPDRSYYLSADPALVAIRRQYQVHLATIFRVSGRDMPERDAAAVLALETRLAAAQISAAGDSAAPSPGGTYPFMRLGRAFPGFDWNAWAEPQGIHRAPNVVVAQPPFFAAFAALVPEVPLDTWRAWLTSRYLTAMSPFVMSELANARFEFFGRILTGQVEPRPPWKRAVALVSEFLGVWIGRHYVDRHFPAESRTRVLAIAREVVAANREAIKESAWMSAAARAEGLRRLSTIELKVGYPDRWRHYNGLDLQPDDLVGNIRRARAFENRYRMERLSEPRDPRQWLMPPHAVNAYYSPVQHAVVMPAGVLQAPYFNADADEAVNYGSIGAVIGHEVSHAPDLRGFESGIRLLVSQTGALTVQETLADLSGLAIAHRAYRRSLRGRPAPELAGASADQRFFLAWARIWREQSRPEFVRSQAGISRYAPWAFRANGLVQHLDAFHEAFNVKPGDQLYRQPVARMRIW